MHDQTGDKIPANSVIIISNNKGDIIQQSEKATDEYLAFPIKYNEPSAEWNVKV